MGILTGIAGLMFLEAGFLYAAVVVHAVRIVRSTVPVALRIP